MFRSARPTGFGALEAPTSNECGDPSFPSPVRRQFAGMMATRQPSDPLPELRLQDLVNVHSHAADGAPIDLDLMQVGRWMRDAAG